MSNRNRDEMTLWVLPPKMTELLSSGTYSDLIIKCKHKEFKVHRAIVCLQSEPMAGFLRHEISKEAQTGVIDLSDDEVELVEMMVKFLYTGKLAMILPRPPPLVPGTIIVTNYPITNRISTPDSILSAEYEDGGMGEFSGSAQNSSSCMGTEELLSEAAKLQASSTLLQATRLYILADRFSLPSLKALAMVEYESALAHGYKGSGFTASLRLMFEETADSDRLLKDCAVKYAGLNAEVLLERADFLSLFKDKPEIVIEIFKSSVKKPNVEHVRSFCECGDFEARARRAIGRSKAAIRSRYETYCLNCQLPIEK